MIIRLLYDICYIYIYIIICYMIIFWHGFNMHLCQFTLKWRTVGLLASFYLHWCHSKMLCTRMPCPYKSGYCDRKLSIWYQSPVVLIGKIHSNAMLFWWLKLSSLHVRSHIFFFLHCGFFFFPIYILPLCHSHLCHHWKPFWNFLNMSSLNMSDSATWF